jgi:hypothetical protein
MADVDEHLDKAIKQRAILLGRNSTLERLFPEDQTQDIFSQPLIQLVYGRQCTLAFRLA